MLLPGVCGSWALWRLGRRGAHPAGWVRSVPAPVCGSCQSGPAPAFSRFASRLAGQGLRQIRPEPGPPRLLAPPRSIQKRGRKASLSRGLGMCPQPAAGGGRRRAASRGAYNVCRLLSRRAHGFYARDAGVAHRINLGLLRKMICQVTAMFSGAG